MKKAGDFIIDYTKRCSNEIESGGWNNGELSPIYQPWITPDDALRAVEIAKEEAEEHFKEKYKEIFNEYWTKGFEDGRDDMYDEFIKDAVDARCFGFQSGEALFSIKLPADKYLVGSKIKVVIIKED